MTIKRDFRIGEWIKDFAKTNTIAIVLVVIIKIGVEFKAFDVVLGSVGVISVPLYIASLYISLLKRDNPRYWATHEQFNPEV